MKTIPFQQDFRPALPNTFSNSDYEGYRKMLVKIDHCLNVGGLEQELVEQAFKQGRRDHNLSDKTDFNQSDTYQWKLLRYALRCNIARHLTGDSFRLFSIRLVDSQLLQWFTNVGDPSSPKATSKSSLNRYAHYFLEDVLRSVLQKWQAKTLRQKDTTDALGLDKPIESDDIWLDSTCVKANIHFPVDWVLLKDAVRSLALAIQTIRAQGLKHRMPSPKLFLRQANQLAMKMTHTRRRKDSQRTRKHILREFKELSRVMMRHAKRYVNLLSTRWQETNWTQKQVQQVIGRIEAIVNQLPAAIKQAHERIIGDRQVRSRDKLLSLYEPDVHVITRGKASAEVEFGNTLLLVEQHNGLIIDWELFKHHVPSDSGLLKPTLVRVRKRYGKLKSVTTDRGFWSQTNHHLLQVQRTYSAICPKSPAILEARLKDKRFVRLQRRRNQTEGRIGIFKNNFLGRPLRTKGFINKSLSVSWCVLVHNLWVLARMALADEQSHLKQAA